MILIDPKINNNINICNTSKARSMFHSRYGYNLNATPVNFTGHIMSEFVGSHLLVQQTSFFREIGSLNFIVKYLKQHYRPNESINILIGGCSTGEEAVSLKLLLGKQRANIRAFDMGVKAIKKAKSGIYSLQRFKDPYMEEICIENGRDAYRDKFLAFDVGGLSEMEQKLKQLFQNNFEVIPEKDKKIPSNRKIKGFFVKILDFLRNMVNPLDIDIEQRNFRYLFNDKIQYELGNILDLDKIAKNNKYDVLTFRNALYHLVTDNGEYNREPLDISVQTKIMIQIVQGANKILKRGGLYVFGENETSQKTNIKLFEKILKENGFAPTSYTNKYKTCNIWKKVSDLS